MTGDELPDFDLAHTLLGLDFDGTLSEIVPDPEDARPAPGAADVLTSLAEAGTRIAVVTGRDAETVLRLSGLAGVPGLVVSGLHGAQWWRDGTLHSREEPAGIEPLREELTTLLADADPGVWLEDKVLSLVVHARKAADPRAALDALRGPVERSATGAGLEVIDGKGVLEIRIPDLSKADAVTELLTPDITGTIFGGDDIGDLPAFQAIHEWGERRGRPAIAVAVGEVHEVLSAADVHLSHPADLVHWLGELLRRSR